MKRIGAGILMMCLLAVLLLPMQVSAEAYGMICNTVDVSTGPGTQYALMPQVTLTRGEWVTVRTKYRSDGVTWLQIDFHFAGGRARGYVRSTDVDADVRNVPTEAPLCTGTLLRADEYAAAGPLYNGYLGYRASMPQGSNVVIYEVENGCAFIEYWNHERGAKCRSWVMLTDLRTDWYFSGSGYYGVALETSLYVPEPTKAPSTYYGSVVRGYPVGKMFTVLSGSCHVRGGPGESYPTVGYAHVGDRYEVLECRTGSTGKDWYRIRINGAEGWISSGLVSLD